MEKIVVMESHGKSKKYQKSWKSKNFTLIRVQNIVRDMVLLKIAQRWISTEKFARISTAEMVMENCNFTLIWIQNIVTDMLVSEIVRKWISCEKLREFGPRKWSWKVTHFTSKYSHGYGGFWNCPEMNYPWKIMIILTAEMVVVIANLVMESHGKVMEFHFRNFVGTL